MINDESELKQLLGGWVEWSKSANKSEDGWQSYFPSWNSLMTAACKLMEHVDLTQENLRLIETCWVISEEDEDIADYAKSNLTKCMPILRLFVASDYPEVRWQVYEVLSEAGNLGEGLLRQALEDKDAYCRRRALLSLKKLNPPDVAEIGVLLAGDSDPHISQIATQMARGCRR